MRNVASSIIHSVGVAMITYSIACSVSPEAFDRGIFNKCMIGSLLLGFAYGTQPLIQEAVDKAAEKWKA